MRQGILPFIAAVLAAGCLRRPVTSGQPSTKTNFFEDVSQDAVDKIDLLFAIDNSASMGDKQEYLEQAIPDLIARLVTPSCVDPKDLVTVLGVSHDDGVCDRGVAEFKPVHDLHIGVVSSSLGPRLGDVAFGQKPSDNFGACEPDATVGALNAHGDDRGHLLTRAGADEHDLAAAPGGFLAWFPSVAENQDGRPAPANPVTSAADLETDFQSLIAGVHQQGCGIESQLESWYRFLVQPDPYDHLELDANGAATWVGVDSTILAQRKAFLRPDSLVAVVVLSDENDSEVDVRALGGRGYYFMSKAYKPFRGTAICDTDPNDPGCKSCSLDEAKSDPACAAGGDTYTEVNDWGYDLNLRHVHMRQKYGVDPQFPIDRYVAGLSSAQIPNRDESGNDCTNPLFAADLPDGSQTDADTLCKLAPGGRTQDLVFYAHIGGVPHELLHFTPNDPAASTLSDADWVKILGKDPEHYDYDGIDAHMIESYKPRDGLAAPSAKNDADSISGREWITDQGPHTDLKVDRQYACIFPLAQPRDCTVAANASACDCTATGLTHDQTSPVCDTDVPTKQTMAKAYPTIRETLLAKKMGKQGIVSSICPIHVTEQTAGDPLYGYRPAVAVIVDRVKTKLRAACLPRKLDVAADGVRCLVLATLKAPGDESACTHALGLAPPDDSVLTPFRQQAHAAWIADGKSGADPDTLPVCEVQQLVADDLVDGACRSSSKPGWCYVEGDAAALDQCRQEVQFTGATVTNGVKFSLECIEETSGAP